MKAPIYKINPRTVNNNSGGLVNASDAIAANNVPRMAPAIVLVPNV